MVRVHFLLEYHGIAELLSEIYSQVQGSTNFETCVLLSSPLMFVKYFLLTTSFPSTPNMCVRLINELDEVTHVLIVSW